jgi:hypothetical protein
MLTSNNDDEGTTVHPDQDYLNRVFAPEGECPTCDRDRAKANETGRVPFGPSHDASTRCQSGRRSHCTCDTCF